jgi:hypothetical protein
MNSTNLQQLFEELCEFKITRYQAQSSLFILAKAVWQENFNLKPVVKPLTIGIVAE